MSQPQLEALILLLAGVLALTALAHRLVIPYPILLVLGGLALAFVPGLPELSLDPDLIFLVFLPPILWAAAYFTSLNEFKANARPIFLLAFGLVLATTGVVAVVARQLFPDMPWASALALGAIVSPPDAVAATVVMRRLQIPPRIVTIIEGESLVNDATALVLYRVAVAAMVTGAFSVGETALQFVTASLLGVGVGVAVGYLSARAIALTAGVSSDILLTLLAPYVAWVLAERWHASAVLACVAGGLMMRRNFSLDVSPETRLEGRAVWDLVIFLLTGLIFILIGLQLGPLNRAMPTGQLWELARAGLVIAAAVVATRLLWVPVATYLPRLLSTTLRARDPLPARSHTFMVAWTGMRGVLSLAAGLALPLTVASGAAFPYRAEIIVITFTVIIVTLVAQGLTLAPLVRVLGLRPDDSREQQLRDARVHAAAAAVRALDEISTDEAADKVHIEHVRALYAEKVASLQPVDPEHAHARRELRMRVIDAERRAAITLRDEGTISDDILFEIEEDLDVDAAQLTRESGEQTPS